MFITRRDALKFLASIVPALKSRRAFASSQFDQSDLRIQAGQFKGTRESLRGYRVPDWFRDAKFGIWAHWGPQSAAERGDWYARNMYIQGEWQYKYHVEHYGHPSKFGFKDIIPTWKAEKFDPDYLMELYKKAGAKYFVSLAVHHDNFDLWNSKYTRWNSVNMGPKKDVVGMLRRAALKHGLRFGVSEHLAMSYKWFSVSHGSDKQGERAGVVYDGADPKYADLYHDIKEVYTNLEWNLNGTSEAFKRLWFRRIKDLVDQYHPDYLYTDGPIPFDDLGLNLVAHFYNQNARRNGRKADAVYMSKRPEDCEVGTCALVVERGIVDDIWPEPWQSETCVGNWHYLKGATYKSPKMIIDMLVDTVSRNGNLLLNFPLPSNGMLDAEEMKILAEITKWMAANGEAIYATRPWKIFGASPAAASPTSDAKFNESKRKALTAEDIRFTTRGQTLFAFIMGWPEKRAIIAPLATNGKHVKGRIGDVELLGFAGKIKWTQDSEGLKVELPPEKPSEHAVVLKVSGLDLS
jgi:alpha-L-fucosidase